jgi:hypothetical protein
MDSSLFHLVSPIAQQSQNFAVVATVAWGEAILHASIVALSITVLCVSVLAYFRRRTRRYLLLSMGFFFLFLAEFSALLEVVFFSNALIIIPSISLHLSHVFDFLMLIFFMLAMTGYGTGGLTSQKPAGERKDSVTYASQKRESVTLEK